MLFFTALLAPSSIGQQVSNTLLFLLGQQYIAQHQQQFSSHVYSVLQKAELPLTAYHLEGVVPQRRGRERWQYREHVMHIPPGLPLNTFETLFRETMPSLPFTILARHVRRTPNHLAVELTFGMAGVPTDILMFTQAYTTVTESLHVAKVPLFLPLEHFPRLPQPSLPQLAIVIDDLGWDLGAAQGLLAIDIPLSFAILPNTPYKNLIAQEAQRQGKEILLHLPMEPYNYPHVDPGQPALLSTMNTKELTAQVEAALAAIPTAVGVSNHMGSRLTENRDAMHVVMQVMKHHNLFFLDSRTSQKSLAYQVAHALGVRTAQRHIFLDNEIDSRKISQQLYRLAALARESGSAIGIGHPYPETVQSFRDTLPEIQQTGVEFVPISRLVQ
jgi:polysaccharide deacetylase 2 family uncharacterized protein YibQ